MTDQLWSQIVRRLEGELTADELQMWVEPIQGQAQDERLMLFAPNGYVRRQLQESYGERIVRLAKQLAGEQCEVRFQIGSAEVVSPLRARDVDALPGEPTTGEVVTVDDGNIDPRYHFDNFVQGKSNQLARAAAMQVAENPGDSAYNPLLFYGGTGLGKTHLLHATGNRLRMDHGHRVVYLHSEQFVSQMIMALRHNTIDQFKAKYRSVDALLIDDIQFFAGKERSQEEFFHTFNTLLDGKQQIILTCDRYPKEVDGLEARLKSRFGWGLSVAIEPPDFETRVAILMSKAAEKHMPLEENVAYFMAKRIRSNVRDLEGALNTLCASARFTGSALTMDFARETLRDLLTVHDRAITIGNIQKVVAEYYKIRVADLNSKRRNRSVARPRQMAMALAKELTEHSLPEIGNDFGGRDHTTVLHACRKIAELKDTDGRIREDYEKLLRELTT